MTAPIDEIREMVDREGRDFHWRGRACKGYTLIGSEWKLICHTGLLAYPPDNG